MGNQLTWLVYLKRIKRLKIKSIQVKIFPTRLIKRLGSGRAIINPFKFDTNTDPTRPIIKL